MRKLASLLLACLMLLAMALPASAADAAIHYRGHGLFRTAPRSEFTRTDLFPAFKDVMPGDTLTQTISVRNSADCCDYIKLYIRAVPHDQRRNPLSEKVAETETLASMEDFLSQLSMTVRQGRTVIFRGSPEELRGLRRNVCLGTFRQDESTRLTVTLEVPVELGNEYAGRIGEVDWVFTVEEYDDERPDTPKTGDHMDSTPYILMLAAGMIGMFFLFFSKKRKKSN